MVKEISGDVLKSWIDSEKNLTIIDARDLRDYKKGHIAEAVSLLNMDVEKRKNEIIKFVQPVVVYSNDVNCPASGYVAEKIEKLGLREVYNYNPSYKDWLEKGYLVIK
ncbi:MAG TPA: rhodanese-like domain-containing protein [Candidatus Humimicrobiaceae bacterium]